STPDFFSRSIARGATATRRSGGTSLRTPAIRANSNEPFRDQALQKCARLRCGRRLQATDYHIFFVQLAWSKLLSLPCPALSRALCVRRPFIPCAARPG